MRSIVRHAWESVPFYREMFERLGLGPGDVQTSDDLARLPIVEREDLQLRLEALTSSRLPWRALNALGLVPYQVGQTVGPWRLRRILEHAGFEILEIGAVEHCPRVLAVAACRLVERAGPAAQRRFLRALLAFERLGRWPTAAWTGHYVAALARRP